MSFPRKSLADQSVKAVHSQYEIIINVNNFIGGFQSRLGGWLPMGRQIKLTIIFINVLSWIVKKKALLG